MKYYVFALMVGWSCLGLAQDPKGLKPEPGTLAPLAAVPYMSQLFQKNEAIVIQCAVLEAKERATTTTLDRLGTGTETEPAPQIRSYIRRIEEEYLRNRASRLSSGVMPNPQGGISSLFSDIAQERGAQPLHVLAAPSLVAVQDHTAVVEIGSETPLEYLESVGNDQYLRKLSEPLKLGLEAHCTVKEIRRIAESIQAASVNESSEKGQEVSTSGLDRRHAKVDTVIKVSSLQGRTPVEGLSLPVGKPIVQRQSIETTLDLVEGKVSHLVLASSNERSLHILIWIGWNVPEHVRN